MKINTKQQRFHVQYDTVLTNSPRLSDCGYILQPKLYSYSYYLQKTTNRSNNAKQKTIPISILITLT